MTARLLTVVAAKTPPDTEANVACFDGSVDRGVAKREIRSPGGDVADDPIGNDAGDVDGIVFRRGSVIAR